MTRILGAIILALATLLTALPAAAQQNPFAVVASVNGQGITRYQVNQRALFLSLLRAPNATAEAALDRLIDETLQVQAARGAGIEVTAEELETGLSSFAGRANLSTEEFVTALEQAGVAGETFRDFVRNGILWRNYVQQRFGPLSRPSPEEIERTLARGGGPQVRVLLSEIALPLAPDTQDEVGALALRLSETISGQAAFEAAARRYSRAASASRGGRVDWVPLSQLAPPIAARVLTLAPGEVSEPVNLGSFIGLFLLRDLDETGGGTPPALSIDYAEYLIPGGRSPEALAQAARVADRVDTCDDLYGVAQGQPPERLIRETVPTAQLPDDLRQVLAVLDEGEISTLVSTGGNLRLIMMCGRVVEPAEGAFDAVGQQLLNQRLQGYADGLLSELRAEAIIERG